MPMKYWLTAFLITGILGQIDTFIQKTGGVKDYKGRNWIMGPSVLTLIFGLVGLVTYIWTLE